MKRYVLGVLVLGIGVTFMTAGCEKKAATSSEAITQTETLKTVEEKENYLVAQANSFLQSENYAEAVQAAQYVLTNINEGSAKAKDILENARKKVEELAQQKLGEVKADANKAMDDVKNKLGNLGK